MTDENRLVLYGSFTSSSSYKPMLFLALSGLPFSFRTVNLKNGVQKQPAHLAINRYGQVPVLKHRGLTLVMSNVILDYLARTTGKFEGASEQDRIHAREWLSWENDAIQNVARVRHFARFRPDVDKQIVDYFRPGAEASLDFIDKHLDGRKWLVGESCTIADLGCWGSHGVHGGGRHVARQAPARRGVARPADGNAGLCPALRPDPQERRRVWISPIEDHSRLNNGKLRGSFPASPRSHLFFSSRKAGTDPKRDP